MILLQGPYPAIETTTALPNPQFSDTEDRRISVEVRRSLNGTKRSYVKTNLRVALDYDFTLRRGKALELREFILKYYAEKILLTNHKNEKWLVNMTMNPFEFSAIGRDEVMQIHLSFEGFQL